MLDWIDFGPRLWVLTTTVQTLICLLAFCLIFGLPLLLVRLVSTITSYLRFSRIAYRIKGMDLDENGLYIGPLLKLQSDRGLLVEANLGRVTVNNNMWVDGRLEVIPGSELHVIGTLFFNEYESSGIERINAGDKRESEPRSYHETDPDAWDKCGGLSGPGTVSGQHTEKQEA